MMQIETNGPDRGPQETTAQNLGYFSPLKNHTLWKGPSMRFAKLCTTVFLIIACGFAPAFAADLLMVGADETNPIYGLNRIEFMRGRVLNGATIGGFSFGNVDTFDTKIATPTLSNLQQYSALVVWSCNSIFDPTALGNNLADYVDAGGNVVIMSFGSAFAPGGRWATGGYDPLIGSYGGENVGFMGTIYDPSNPIFAGVSTITAEYIQPGTVRAGATLLASWDASNFNSSLAPMVIQSNGLTGKVVNLNFYGAYPNVSTNGDIDRLIANTLNVLTMPEPATWLLGLVAAVVLSQSIRHRRKSMRLIQS